LSQIQRVLGVDGVEVKGLAVKEVEALKRGLPGQQKRWGVEGTHKKASFETAGLKCV